ncbi:MAG TPA: poly(A) polymerase [Cyanobacteria bacterium UBA11366]|nr:poly(A) polymerase [Cyanobacteria bacterium UBA11366]HBS70317.1 poly(A) polymerase [Cyanobacteria bacterium UBA11153]
MENGEEGEKGEGRREKGDKGDKGDGGDKGDKEEGGIRAISAKYTSHQLSIINCQLVTHSRLTIIGRTRIEGTNLNELFQPFGGGGHSQAAAVNLREVNPLEIIEQFIERIKYQIPQPLTARELMSSPVRTIRPETTISEAQRILLRYGHSGLSVVDETDNLVGIISRRDLDLALHHGFSHAPVKGYMTRNVKTINPLTSLPEIESLMVTYDIGRLPVLENSELVGIVTRTDVLRQLHQKESEEWRVGSGKNYCPLPMTNLSSRITNLEQRLAPGLWQLLIQAAAEAEKRGWHLYLVGGAVRDLLLADENKSILLNDIDLVVDGFHKSGDAGAGVRLAKALRKHYPKVRLEIHGAFQTAALLWHNDPKLGSLWVDIATARTEFYPYPAANPEVEASSIRQDLYRRDFTINAIALRLTDIRKSYTSPTLAQDDREIISTQPPLSGSPNPKHDLPLLDFFGGLLDLRSRHIRVLHPNSFIEDPTRIYRAVRFAVRLGFEIESQTEGYIRYALASGVYERSLANNNKAPALQTRLKQELKYILQAPYWQRALQLLGDLEALRCLHPRLHLDEQLWWRIRLVERWLRRFDPSETLRHWEIRLEVLIAHLAPEERSKVAQNLQMPLDSIQRLENLENAQNEVTKSLPRCRLPCEFVRLLRQYNRGMLVLIAVHSPRIIRRKIWQYFTIWANIKPLINGNELKQMGYKPSPRFKEILEALLDATLNGIIGDEEEAKGFLEKYYPLGGVDQF